MVMFRKRGAWGTSENLGVRRFVHKIEGTKRWARRYPLTPSRTSERSERDAGPISPNGYVGPSGGRSSVYNRHRWLWVPAFAGTTKVGEVLFPHVVPDK